MKLQITQKQLCQILSGALHAQVESVEIIDKPAVSENSHNPDGLTPEKYGAAEGYRLLDEDEIKNRSLCHFGIELWDGSEWKKIGYTGSSIKVTYRTRLSREELVKLD